MKATCILVDGPFPNASARSEWDEFPEWTVCKMDDQGNEGQVSFYRSYNVACNAGEGLSEENGLELIIEAQPASGGLW